MLTFCLTCRLYAADKCDGMNNPGDCRKQRGNQIRHELMEELAECAGVN
jgi:hypothetical protein